MRKQDRSARINKKESAITYFAHKMQGCVAEHSFMKVHRIRRCGYGEQSDI